MLPDNIRFPFFNPIICFMHWCSFVASYYVLITTMVIYR